MSSTSTLEEFIHHNLVLRKGPIAAVAAFAYRVKSPAEVDAAEAYYQELGCRTERRHRPRLHDSDALQRGRRLREDLPPVDHQRLPGDERDA